MAIFRVATRFQKTKKNLKKGGLAPGVLGLVPDMFWVN